MQERHYAVAKKQLRAGSLECRKIWLIINGFVRENIEFEFILVFV